jgi:uncharacterized membrane protein
MDGIDPRWSSYRDLLDAYGAVRPPSNDRALTEDGVLEGALAAAGFARASQRFEEIQIVYRDADDWWKTQWSHAFRNARADGTGRPATVHGRGQRPDVRAATGGRAAVHVADGVRGRVRGLTHQLHIVQGEEPMPELVTPLKILHILSAIVAVGSNISYVFWLRWAGHDRDRLRVTLNGIEALDSRFANPAYLLLLVTGIGMVVTGVYRFEQTWIAAGLTLYVVAAVIGGFIFAPALRRQREAARRDPTTPEYAALERRTSLFGSLSIAIVVVIVILMVAKPQL